LPGPDPAFQGCIVNQAANPEGFFQLYLLAGIGVQSVTVTFKHQAGLFSIGKKKT
jgi:hypothetical protein